LVLPVLDLDWIQPVLPGGFFGGLGLRVWDLLSRVVSFTSTELKGKSTSVENGRTGGGERERERREREREKETGAST